MMAQMRSVLCSQERRISITPFRRYERSKECDPQDLEPPRVENAKRERVELLTERQRPRGRIEVGSLRRVSDDSRALSLIGAGLAPAYV
jgi:hypothetical protein